MEYKINTATVRIHSEPDQERIKTATEKFLKQVLIQRKKVQSEAQKEANGTAKKADAKVEAEC